LIAQNSGEELQLAMRSVCRAFFQGNQEKSYCGWDDLTSTQKAWIGFFWLYAIFLEIGAASLWETDPIDHGSQKILLWKQLATEL
jgi:hypothetical protein